MVTTIIISKSVARCRSKRIRDKEEVDCTERGKTFFVGEVRAREWGSRERDSLAGKRGEQREHGHIEIAPENIGNSRAASSE